jgi:hypothetical protein
VSDFLAHQKLIGNIERFSLTCTKRKLITFHCDIIRSPFGIISIVSKPSTSYVAFLKKKFLGMFQKSKLGNFAENEFFFRAQKFGWKIIGFWPGDDVITKIELFAAICKVFEIFVYSLFQLNFCYSNRGNLVALLDALTPCSTEIVSGSKILVIMWKRKEIKNILDQLKESFYTGDKNNLFR